MSWYLIILIFSGGIEDVICERVSAIESAIAWNRGIPYKIWKITHSFTIFKYIVISKLLISWLLNIAEHPPNSTDIDPEIQDG